MPRNDETLAPRKPVAPLGIIPLSSIEKIGQEVDDFLVKWRDERNYDEHFHVVPARYRSDSFIVECDCPRFGSGEAKGMLKQSVRGLDVYIMVDITN